MTRNLYDTGTNAPERSDSAEREKPKAVGLVRTDVSGLDATQHALEIRCHAEKLGYRYLYTVRPPTHRGTDPIDYALGIAIGVHAAALIVHDLPTVDNAPGRVCETCDLETVFPPTTWPAATEPADDRAHAYPRYSVGIAEAHRIMQQHRACRAFGCHLKATALSVLTRSGKLIPQTVSPRERAAARGLAFPSLTAEPVAVAVPDVRTLRTVLDALSVPDSGPAGVHRRTGGCGNSTRRPR